MKKFAMMLTALVVGWTGLARAEENIFTNVYVVPLEFQTTELPSSKQDGSKSGETAEDKASRLSKRTAKDILKSAGISFPEGASATYDRSTSKLIVRNTTDQMELVEAYVEWVKKALSKKD